MFYPEQECGCSPQQYYNYYPYYQDAGYIEPAYYENREVVYHTYPVPENYRYPEQYAELQVYKVPGESCCSTVSANVYYNVDDHNKQNDEFSENKFDCSPECSDLDFENYWNCGCKNSDFSPKCSDCCSCNKSICTCNSECRCNRRKCDSKCQNNGCTSKNECVCGRCSCFDTPKCKCQNNKSCCRSSKCNGGNECCNKSDDILDCIKAVSELLTTLLSDACDCV